MYISGFYACNKHCERATTKLAMELETANFTLSLAVTDAARNVTQRIPDYVTEESDII